MYSVDDYAGRFLSLLPQGAAWPRDKDSVLARTVRGMSHAFARLSERAVNLIRDAHPNTTLELLPEWERSLGLPDECIGPGATLEIRQQQVRGKFAAVGGQTPDYYINVARNLGFEVTITEFRVAEADHLCADAHVCQDNAWDNVWLMKVLNGDGPKYFRAGISAAGDPLYEAPDDGLACVFRRIMPAHTQLIITYDTDD